MLIWKRGVKIIKIIKYKITWLFSASQQLLRTHKKKKKYQKKGKYVICGIFFPYQHTSIKALIIRKILDARGNAVSELDIWVPQGAGFPAAAPETELHAQLESCCFLFLELAHKMYHIHMWSE